MDDQEYTLFGKPIERLSRPFCEKCADLWKKDQYPFCYNCHKEMDTLYFGIIRAPGIYRSERKNGNHLSEVIKCFKYQSMPHRKRQKIAAEFADLLCAYVSDESEIVDGVDCLVPIPTTKAKKEERGFDHIGLIVQKFSEKVKIRAEFDNLVKIRETKSQTDLSRDERRENLKGAFYVMCPERFKGMKVLLIDDVATSCSAIDECAKVLKNAEAQEVNALVLARDTQPSGDSSE
jgi:ComF family protein